MKRLIFALLWLLTTSPLPALAQGVPNSAQVVSSCGSTPSTYTAGLNYPLLQDTSGRQCINTGGSSTNTNVNVQQVGGASVSTAASGTQKVGVVGNAGTALDSAAGTPNAQAVTIQGNASGVAVPVSGTVTPLPQTAVAPTVSASGGVTSLVLKASPTTTGVQYFHAENASAVAGYCILFNATSAPSTGSLTAADVLAFQFLPASGYCDVNRPAVPIAASAGAVVLLSSASTPFTYTTGSITGSIYGLAQ